MSGRYEVRFVESETCASDVVSFRFTKPDGYTFLAGQWLRLTLDTVEGPQTKTFTHSSAPADELVEITTRVSGSAFKNALGALSAGDTVQIAGPGGHLTLPAVDRVAFLVGGTGITPVRSMLRDAASRGRVFDDALLLYGNRDSSCVPFGNEFTSMSGIGVRMILCFEHPDDGWEGERGFITANTVRRHLDSDDTRPFIVAGPPVMVASMERVLDDLSIPDSRRLIERYGPAV